MFRSSAVTHAGAMYTMRLADYQFEEIKSVFASKENSRPESYFSLAYSLFYFVSVRVNLATNIESD